MKAFRHLFFAVVGTCFFAVNVCCAMQNNQNNYEEQLKEYKKRAQAKHAQQIQAQQITKNELSESQVQPNVSQTNTAKPRRKILTNPCNSIILPALPAEEELKMLMAMLNIQEATHFLEQVQTNNSEHVKCDNNQSIEAKPSLKRKKKLNKNNQKTSVKRKIDQIDEDQEVSDVSVQEDIKRLKLDNEDGMDCE